MKKICALFLILLLTACASAPTATLVAGTAGSTGAKSQSTVQPTAQTTVQPTAQTTVQPTAQTTVQTTVQPTAQTTVKPTVQPTAKCDIKYSNDPGWKVSFCEKFDDNSRGWIISPIDTKYLSGESDLANGVYTVTITGKASSNFLNAGTHTIPLGAFGKTTSYYLGITGRINSKFKNSSWGIGLLGDDDRNSYLQFGLLKDSYSLYRHNKDAYITDAKIDTKVTDKINIGEMNSMELKRDGDFLEYFINGKSMGTYNLSKLQYPGTNAYLFFLVDEGAKAIFDIDNFLIEIK